MHGVFFSFVQTTITKKVRTKEMADDIHLIMMEVGINQRTEGLRIKQGGDEELILFHFKM